MAANSGADSQVPTITYSRQATYDYIRNLPGVGADRTDRHHRNTMLLLLPTLVDKYPCILTAQLKQHYSNDPRYLQQQKDKP